MPLSFEWNPRRRTVHSTTTTTTTLQYKTNEYGFRLLYNNNIMISHSHAHNCININALRYRHTVICYYIIVCTGRTVYLPIIDMSIFDFNTPCSQ